MSGPRSLGSVAEPRHAGSMHTVTSSGVSGPASSDPRSLEQLHVHECWRLVGRHGLGRLGFVGRSHLQVVPTMYDAQHGTAYFRASTFGALARSVHDKMTVLQVDDIDPETFTGWSVTITGTAHRVQDAGTLALLSCHGRPPVWVPGTSTQWIALPADTIEGQRVVT